MMRISLRRRLILWNTLILVGLFAALGVAAHYVVRSMMLSGVDRDLTRRTNPPASMRDPAARRTEDGPRRGQGGEPPTAPTHGPSGIVVGTVRGRTAPPVSQRGLRPAPKDGARVGAPDQPRDWAPDGHRPPRDEGGPPPGMPEEGEGPGGGEHGRPEPPQPSDMQFPMVDPRPRVIAADGRVLMPRGVSAPFDPRPIPRARAGFWDFREIGVDGTPVRLVTRPGQGGLVIQAAFPMEEVHRATSNLDMVMFAFLPFAIAFAALGGWGLTRRVLRPVLDLTTAAASIGTGNLRDRLPVESDDEFGALSRTFNQMLERIDDAFQEQGRLVEELRTLVEQQRRFTADASHELRTPLTVIKANTSLCMQGDATADDLRQSMADIDTAADGMGKLVADLLILARADAGRLGQEREPVPASALLTPAVAALRRTGGPTIEVRVPDPEPLLMVCRDEVGRVVLNLLQNAVRATPAAGHITVAAAAEGAAVSLTITDTGSGIAPEHLPHLGERFYRVDTSRTRAHGGSGLGLSICRGIVEAHGGEMRIASEIGVGTTVTVLLPAATQDASDEDLTTA